jgi:hypothetical protein
VGDGTTNEAEKYLSVHKKFSFPLASHPLRYMCFQKLCPLRTIFLPILYNRDITGRLFPPFIFSLAASPNQYSLSLTSVRD